MNALESCIILSPSSIEEECAKFTIEETLSPFVLHNITKPGGQYTLSLWVKSENEGSILSRGTTMPTTSEWSRYTVTFNTNETDVSIFFNTADTYYIYHAKLEEGSKATDWTAAPEDLEDKVEQIGDTATDAFNNASDNSTRLEYAESIIEQLIDRISMIVTDSNGTTLWEQTADSGWTFSMAQTQADVETIRGLLGELEQTIGSVSGAIDVLKSSLTDIETSVEWVKITTFEDEPCIALGETDSGFRLLITNTRIMFVEGTSVVAYVSNQALNIKKAVIEEELQQGPFVWKIRSSGNMGLLWKGVTN